MISNACSKEVIYKQKGTDIMFYLGIGEHAHLHWTDTTRYVFCMICISLSHTSVVAAITNNKGCILALFSSSFVFFQFYSFQYLILAWCRELLVSICYNESGWQWSGSFLPDHLGDTQLKMRNFVLGTSNMIRVEVQNADISVGDEKIVGSIKGNSGTNLILLSDDDTGYMPYRIDNFSKEVCL